MHAAPRHRRRSDDRPDARRSRRIARACYRCHPGSATRCLRGAMGAAVAARRHARDAVPELPRHDERRRRAPTRTGWLDEPTLPELPHRHRDRATTGRSATRRVFDAPRPSARRGRRRPSPPTPTRPRRASRSTASRPATAACSARPATARRTRSSRRSHRNDNLQSIAAPGPRRRARRVHRLPRHAAARPSTGGPHGMHPVGQDWVERHPDVVEEGGAARLPRLPRRRLPRHRAVARRKAIARWPRTFGTKHFWRGFQIGCYTPPRLSRRRRRWPRPGSGRDSSARSSTRCPATGRRASRSAIPSAPSRRSR